MARNFYTSADGTGDGLTEENTMAFTLDPADYDPPFGTLVGDVLEMREGGGRFHGKFDSMFNGGTVRSRPGEQATIDGNVTTTLTAAINSSQTSFGVANGAVLLPAASSGDIVIDGEVIQVYGISGNTITNCLRGASGTVGSAASHSNGATVVLGGNQLRIFGDNTTFEDIEVTNSIGLRNADTTPWLALGGGIDNKGGGNKFINMISHDNLDGMGSSNDSSDTEWYGGLSYNNGMAVTGDAKVGNGGYFENSSGFSRIWEFMAFNNFNMGVQLFGQTGSYVGGNVQGSVFANNGSPEGNPNRNLLVGTNSVLIDEILIEASHFFHAHDSAGYLLTVGFGAGVTLANLLDNYLVGGAVLMQLDAVASAVVTGNKHYSRNSFPYYTSVPATSPYTWNNQTYYDAAGRTVYVKDDTGYNFADWKTATGFDASSTETGAAMPDTVVVRPNAYRAGGNVIIYAPSAPVSINVNLSTLGFVNGQGYTIHNAFHYFGTPVATGTYNSSSPIVSLNLADMEGVATPTGFGSTPTTTVPDFAALVVVGEAQVQSVPRRRGVPFSKRWR